VDMAQILREEGFFTPTRRLSGDGSTRTKRAPGLGVIGRHAPVALDHFVIVQYMLCTTKGKKRKKNRPPCITATFN
jgi:hypothetical protein